MKVAVIGGGAAGFFSAISAKQHHPEAEVTIYEKSDKVLSKVRVSGGGRCNVTHHCLKVSELVKHYPRGEKPLKKAFGLFAPTDTIKWFNERGVELKVEDDGRMFPITDSSETIIQCLMNEVKSLGISIKLKSGVKNIIQNESNFELEFTGKNKHTVSSPSNTKSVDKVIVATGGSPRISGFEWLKKLDHEIEEPVPSLFTFNMPNETITSLMGVVANPVSVKIMGSSLKSEGPLLITHWGMSGPAVLKLSAFGARELFERDYDFKILINWTGELNENEIRAEIKGVVNLNGKKRIHNVNPFHLPGRLWEYIVQKLELGDEMIWQNMGKKNINRLVHILTNDTYSVKGKTTFKEEFVTCGGIKLNNVDFKTMQSRKAQGLYFAGEVLDVDGVTGGFNFQAAWTTGFIAGKLLD